MVPRRSIRAPTGVTFPCTKRRHSSDSPPPPPPNRLRFPRNPDPSPPRPGPSKSLRPLLNHHRLLVPAVYPPSAPFPASGQLVEERGRQSWPRKAPRRGRGCKSELLKLCFFPTLRSPVLLKPYVTSTLHGVRLHQRTHQPQLESTAYSLRRLSPLLITHPTTLFSLLFHFLTQSF